ncbi:hypothetical protein [Massilia sp. TSP1-1-2]|uniref:hypothetical protein n=1 Tax=Massilia sp. TSP1-1-2 TaxID=2804649 RepID=UPI003CF0A548
MDIQKYKRINRAYSPHGNTVRAALDFATSIVCFHRFEPARGMPLEELRRKAIERFDDRQVVSATFSMVSPEGEEARQPFRIIFTSMADGHVPIVEVNIKSVVELRARAKLYRRDASAYSEVRKPRRKGRNLDKTL